VSTAQCAGPAASSTTPCLLLLLLLPPPPNMTLQVIDETHGAYVRLKSGKRANSEELSLI
jgi:hypothetical protein